MHKIRDLHRRAREQPIHTLLSEVMGAGLLAALDPRKPPAGAKLLADEIANSHAHAERQTLQLTPMAPGARGGEGRLGDRRRGGRGGRAARPPPPPSTGHLEQLRAFLEHASMSEHEQAGHGRPKQPGGGVTLSTIHGAKGREWSAVLLLRVNEDVLPLSSGLDDDEDLSEAQLAEERRLLYVGMTRARRVLKLSYTMLHADRTVGRASRFLKSIPPELVVKADHFELAQPRRRAVTGEAFAQPHAGSGAGAGAGAAAAQRQTP